MRALLLAGIALLLLPLAAAHGGQPGIDDQLVDKGKALQIGTFTAPQPGALVVVPYVAGAQGCSPPAAADYRIALGKGSGVSFAQNDRALVAYFDLPSFGEGYAAFAVDTHDATRALILMQENAVAIHALAGVVERGSDLELDTGALGVPYPIAGTAMHEMPQRLTPEGGGIVMDQDDSFHGARACPGTEVGHFAIVMDAANLTDSIAPGKLVHAVVMFDPTLADAPPRPLDGTTALLQLNLYLDTPHEDPQAVRAALDPSMHVADAIPMFAMIGGIVVVVRR